MTTNMFIENIPNVEDRDAVVVNEKEKNIFQRNAEKMKIAEKLKKNEPVLYDDMPWLDVLSKSYENLRDQAIPYFKKTIDSLFALMHTPIADTIPALAQMGKEKYDTLAGGLKIGREMARQYDYTKLPSEQVYKKRANGDKQRQAWIDFENDLYNEFGTEANLKRRVAEKPWENLEIIGLVAHPLSRAYGVNWLKKVSSSLIDPQTLWLKTIGLPTKMLRRVPEHLHSRALALGRTVPDFKKERMVSVSQNLYLTAKKEHRFTMTSLEKLNKVERDLERVKIETLKAMGNKGAIPRKEFYIKLDEYEKKIMATSIKGSSIKKEVQDVKDWMKEAEEELNRKNMTTLEIQEAVARHNKEFDKVYDNLHNATGSLPYNEEIAKLIADSMRNYLEIIVPEMRITKFDKITKNLLKKEFGVKDVSIKQLKEIQGAVIDLREVIKNEVSSSVELLPFQVGQKASTLQRAGRIVAAGGAGFATGAGLSAAGGGKAALVGGAIGNMLGIGLGLIDSSTRIKMSLGNLMNKLKKVGLYTSPNASLIRWGLYKAGDVAKTTTIDQDSE